METKLTVGAIAIVALKYAGIIAAVLLVLFLVFMLSSGVRKTLRDMATKRDLKVAENKAKKEAKKVAKSA